MQYQKFKAILDQRPKMCTIDSCPFVANALKCQHVAFEIEELSEQYKKVSVSITQAEDEFHQFEKDMIQKYHAYSNGYNKNTGNDI